MYFKKRTVCPIDTRECTVASRSFDAHVVTSENRRQPPSNSELDGISLIMFSSYKHALINYKSKIVIKAHEHKGYYVSLWGTQCIAELLNAIVLHGTSVYQSVCNFQGGALCILHSRPSASTIISFSYSLQSRDKIHKIFTYRCNSDTQ